MKKLIAGFSQELRKPGGLQLVLATLAIGWGISTIQKVLEEKQATVAALDEIIAERIATLNEPEPERDPEPERPLGHVVPPATPPVSDHFMDVGLHASEKFDAGLDAAIRRNQKPPVPGPEGF